MITFDQLRIFLAVAEREHLTQAAAALALTPSAVSASIKVLEDRYGTVLFHRVGRRIALTSEGRIFVAEARRALAGARAAEAALHDLGSTPRGTLSIHASQTIASYWLPAMLVRFRQQHPHIVLQVSVGNTDTVAAAVREGAADLGFVEGVVEAPGLVGEVVGMDDMLVVTSPGHALANKPGVGNDDLLAATWILRETGSGTRSAFEHALGSRGIPATMLDVALTLPSNEAVRSAVMDGTFATAMSSLVVASHIAAGLLARVDFALPARSFSTIRHPERHRSRAALAFEALVRAR